MSNHRFSERVLSVEASGIRKFFQNAKPGSISLALGQPDLDTPDHIRQAAITAIQEGKTGYTFNAGLQELRDAVSGKFRRENRLQYSPDQIIITAGAGEALFIAIQTLVNPGDRVLITDPGFVSYDACTKIAGGKMDPIPLKDNLHIDLDAALEKMAGSRLLILNSPCNPTGIVEPEETIRALVEAAMDAGVTVLADEVYEHLIYDASHTSAAQYGEDVLTVNATSKTYSMTGWRVGYLAGPQDYIDQALKIHQYCQTCATSVSQYAAVAAYTGDQSCVAAMRDEYRVRRDILCNGLNDLGFEFPVPQGAFYAFVPLGTEVTAQVLDAGVIIVPGDAFGERANNYARFSYATSRENLRLALKRIESVVR
jgi:aspartate aminotransferase